jgi:hypothetical protein
LNVHRGRCEQRCGLFAIGVAVESSHVHDETSEVTGSLPGVEGSAEHEAAERGEAARGHEDEERLLGLDPEAPLAVTGAVVGRWDWLSGCGCGSGDGWLVSSPPAISLLESSPPVGLRPLT